MIKNMSNDAIWFASGVVESPGIAATATEIVAAAVVTATTASFLLSRTVSALSMMCDLPITNGAANIDNSIAHSSMPMMTAFLLSTYLARVFL